MTGFAGAGSFHRLAVRRLGALGLAGVAGAGGDLNRAGIHAGRLPMADDDTVLKPDRPRADVTLAPGALVLHTYRVERLLDKGGMGEVYLARHTALGTQHAIKVIKPELITNPMVLELSQREAMVLRDVHNDAIVGYEGFLQDDTGHWYLCMEYVDGPSLMDLLERPEQPNDGLADLFSRKSPWDAK